MAPRPNGEPERVEGLVEEALPGLTFRIKLKGISSAKLSLWPRWLTSLPKDAVKVEIRVD